MSETLRHYDRWSSSYDAHDNPMIGATAWALDVRPFDCVDCDVLELGCGTGRHVAGVVARSARSYVGLDGSPGMLSVAKRLDVPGARFVEADLGAHLPFENASFDRVLVVLVLEHLPSLEGIFCEIGRVLRPGGMLRLLEIHPDLVAGGTAAHFRDAAGEVRFDVTPHATDAILGAIAAAGLSTRALHESRPEGELLARVPKLGKHRVPVLLDVEAVAGR